MNSNYRCRYCKRSLEDCLCFSSSAKFENQFDTHRRVEQEESLKDRQIESDKKNLKSNFSQYKNDMSRKNVVGAEVVLTNAKLHEIPTMNFVLFDTILQLHHAINYQSESGIFTFQTSGIYMILWWVAIRSFKNLPYVAFGICLNNEVHGISYLPSEQGQLSGHSLVDVLPKDELSLIHASDVSICYADVPVQSNLCMIKII